METVRVEKVNECFMQVHCDDGLDLEIYLIFFSFSVPNAKFMFLLLRIDIGTVKSDYSRSKLKEFISVSYHMLTNFVVSVAMTLRALLMFSVAKYETWKWKTFSDH